MDLWKTVQVLLRRWYVVVPVLALSLGAAFAVFSATPTYYTSTGMAILTTPTGGSILDSDPLKRKVRLNPLLNFDAGLKVTSSVLMAILASPDTMAQLSTHGAGDSLTVAPPPTTDGPFIMITAVSASAADAKLMVERTITKSAEELQSRQANLGAPPSTFIHLEVVVPATPAASQIKSKVRGAAAVLGVGVALTLTLVYGLESFLTRRRQDDLPVAEPQAGTEPEDEPATVPEPEPERAG